MRHMLYRFYSDAGQLLYVGITMDPASRLKNHRDVKDWWFEVAGVTMQEYPDRKSVTAAETRAIRVERPKYNVVRPSMPSTIADSGRSFARIEWHCDRCAGDVSDGEGYLVVSRDEVEEFRLRSVSWERSAGVPIRGMKLYSERDFRTYPNAPRWEAFHAGCDPVPERDDVYIPIFQLRTFRDLLSWTLHFYDEGIHETTNWHYLMELIQRYGTNMPEQSAGDRLDNETSTA